LGCLGGCDAHDDANDTIWRFLPITAGLAMAGMALSPVPASAQASKTPIKFVMDWAFEGAQAFWTLAHERGCFAQAGMDVKIDRGFGSGDAVSKVASGAYDIGVSDFATLLSYNASHAGEKLIGVMVISDRQPSAIATLEKNGIAKPADLIGRSIGDAQGEAARVLFPAFAKANGIPLDSIKWVTISAPMRQTTLAQGQSDAIAGHTFTMVTGLRALASRTRT